MRGIIPSITGTLASTIGQLNPLRYRSYVYDNETGLYYLQSRYYRPSWGRFISSDSQLNTSQGLLGINQFAYCLNNPVNKVDYYGNKPGDIFATKEAAVRDAALYIGALSFDKGWEYGASIYVRKVTITTTTLMYYSAIYGPVYATKTVTQYSYVVSTDKDPWSIAYPKAPESTKRVATVHTHPMGSGLGITRFSDIDKTNAIKRGIPNYVYGPNGKMRKFDPETGDDILLFSDLPVSPKTPWLD